MSFLSFSYNKGSKKFEAKRNEATEEWRRLHTEEMCDQYCSPHIDRMIRSRTMRIVGHVVRMGKRNGVYRGLVGRSEGKRPL